MSAAKALHRWREHAFEAALGAAARALFGPGASFEDSGRRFPVAYLPAADGPYLRRALRRIRAPGSGPFVAHLAVTGACPWSCGHCYASAGGPGAADLGDDASVGLAAALAREQVPLVILAGGEPLARFPRALAMLRALRGASEVRLATSGAGLTPPRAATLREEGLAAIAISVDGHDPQRVDAVRGGGSLQVAWDALSVASEAGLPTLVTCVIGPDALPDAEAVERLVTSVRARHPRAVVGFLPRFATGRANVDGFRSPGEYAPVARGVLSALRARALPGASFYGPTADRLFGCVGAGGLQAVVTADGDLRACVSGASFGNLVREPFGEVWGGMIAAPARFKRGYLCAQVGAQAPTDAQGALRAFHEGAPDALLQRWADGKGRATGLWRVGYGS